MSGAERRERGEGGKSREALLPEEVAPPPSGRAITHNVQDITERLLLLDGGGVPRLDQEGGPGDVRRRLALNRAVAPPRRLCKTRRRHPSGLGHGVRHRAASGPLLRIPQPCYAARRPGLGQRPALRLPLKRVGRRFAASKIARGRRRILPRHVRGRRDGHVDDGRWTAGPGPVHVLCDVRSGLEAIQLQRQSWARTCVAAMRRTEVRDPAADGGGITDAMPGTDAGLPGV
eukprot:973846-Rhodomonas_salina.1